MKPRIGHLMAIACLLATVGCSQRVSYTPSQNHETLDSAEFVHYLARQPMVTFGEACRAMLIVADGDEQSGSFDARRAELESRGIVRDAWGLSATDAVDRGTLAYMIFRTCDLPAGLSMSVFGQCSLGDRRYAMREVAYQRIMRPGPPYRIATGGELVSAMGNADDYLASHGAYETGEGDIDFGGGLDQP
jgi:hypothetical protein